MILVVGATGQLGGMIARELLRRGEPVRALVREGSDPGDLVAAGAEPVSGDLKDRESLDKALAGVDAVVTTANAASRAGTDTIETVDRLGNRNLLAAAEHAGARRFVFVSALGADPASPVPLMRAKGETEHALRTSALAWTIVSANIFLDVWVPAVVGAPVAAGQPVTLVSEGRRRHSFVSVRDVCAYTVAAVQSPAAERQTLPVGGPQPVSWRDIVAAAERVLGREIPVRTVGLGEPVPGLPDVMSGLLTALETFESPMEMEHLAATYRVTPTPLDEGVRIALGAAR